MRQRADAGVTLAVEQHDDQLEPFLHRRDDLLSHHQVRPVADHHEHVARRIGHLHAQAAGNLVAHARIAILEVIGVRPGRAPQLVQIAGDAAGRADHHVLGSRKLVDGADNFTLRERRHRALPVHPIDLGIPLPPAGVKRGAIVGGRRVSRQQHGELLDRLAGVGHHGKGRVLEGVQLAHVDADEPHLRMRERAVRHGREVAQARANGDHQVGGAREPVRRRGSRHADPADGQWVIPWDRALAGLRFSDADAGHLGEAPQGVRGFAIEHAAARDDQRRGARSDRVGRPGDRAGIAAWAGDGPHPLVKERVGIIKGFRLRVLGQRQRHGAGVGGRGQHAHGVGQRAQQLLGPVNPIPIAGDRAQAVVHRNVLGLARFELLQHGGRRAVGEDVAGQQQHRQAIDGGAGGPGHQVGRTRADRRGTGQRSQPVRHLGEPGGGVDHRLFVAALVVAQAVAHLIERLADAGDVAVTENSEHPGEERLPPSVALAELHAQKPHQRLRHGQSRHWESGLASMMSRTS